MLNKTIKTRRSPYNSRTGPLTPPIRVFKTPSNAPTFLQYVPNPRGVRDFSQALTQAYLKSNAHLNAGTAYAHIYDDFFKSCCDVIKAAFRGDPIPPFNPLPWPLAMVFFMYNSRKLSEPLAGGQRYSFGIADHDFSVLPPDDGFALPGSATDSNGFGILPDYNPGNEEERKETWQFIMSASSRLRSWSIGDPLPEWVNGISQFATLFYDSTSGPQTVTNQNMVAHTFLPLKLNLLAFLNLVRIDDTVNASTIMGKFQYPLHAPPHMYAGYFASTYSPNLRMLMDINPFRLEDLVALYVGVMKGVNDQCYRDGVPPLYINVDPVYFWAHLLAMVGMSQMSISPVVMDTRGNNTTSVPFGAQLPFLDFVVMSAIPGPLLIVEYLRRVKECMIEIPRNGKLAPCLMIPVFMYDLDIKNYIEQAFTYAGIGVASLATDILLETFQQASTGLRLSFAPRNAGNPAANTWQYYIKDHMERANQISIYMPFRHALPAHDFRWNATAYFHANVSLEDFLFSVERALAARQRTDDRVTARLREMHATVSKLARPPSLKKVSSQPLTLVAPTEPLRLGLVSVGTCTYHAFGESVAIFAGLPIGRKLLVNTNPISVSTDVAKQFLSVNQITTVSGALDNDPSMAAYLLGMSCVASSKKDTPPNELMLHFTNQDTKGKGGAFTTIVNGVDEVSRAIYKNTSKKKGGRTKQEMDKYDAVAKPVKKIVMAATKPVARVVDKVLK